MSWSGQNPINDGRPRSTYSKLRELPVIGPWVGRARRVQRIMAMPCSPTPTMWVQAAFVSAPRLLWTLYKPDFLDLAYNRFRPRRGAHGRRVFNALGGLEPQHPAGRGLGWVPWALGDLAQRIGWYFIVIDATTEFAVNWTTLAMQYSGCNDPNAPWAENRNLGGNVLGFEPLVFLIDTWLDPHSHFYSAGAIGISTSGPPPSVGFSAVARVNAAPPFPDASFTLYLFDFNPSVFNPELARGSAQSYSVDNGGQQAHLAWENPYAAGSGVKQWRVIFEKSFGALGWDKGMMQAQGGGPNIGITFDP